MTKSPEESYWSHYGGYNWKKEYPYVCDTDFLKKWIKGNRKCGNRAATVIANAIGCNYNKGLFLGAKGLFTMHEAKKMAVSLDMDFWTFYQIFLKDIYKIEWDDVSFLRRKWEDEEILCEKDCAEHRISGSNINSG